MNQAIAEPEEGPDLTVKQELRPIQKERHKRPLFPQKEQHANPTTNATASQLHETLNSWKEIASYLDRGVRTVQRWEKNLQLPVRRIGKGKRAPAFAVVSEVKLWMETFAVSFPPDISASKTNCYDPDSRKSIAQLRARLLHLSQAVAAASVLQWRQTAALEKNIAALRSRVFRRRAE